MKTGIANLPLHDGKAPTWLFSRMKLLTRKITLVVVEEFGPVEMVRRLSDSTGIPAELQLPSAVPLKRD